MATKKKLLQAAAGQAGGEALNVEDVFSTYLYTGTGSSQTITNGIDLSGEGGAVWIKSRTTTAYNLFHDTERGATKTLYTNTTNAEITNANGLSAFTSSGFTVGTEPAWNGSGVDLASWTFRKAPKFFDVVTYTGNGTAGRTVSHNLETDVGFMIIKNTTSSGDWICWHRSASNDPGRILKLNATDAVAFNSAMLNNTNPTSTEFTLGTNFDTNGSGQTYVAYLFAHNDGDGEFGPDGDADIIKCGSVSYNAGATVDLGFEPQWVLIKPSNNTGNWILNDVMRGMPNGSRGPRLDADGSGAELANATVVYPTSTGFTMPAFLYDPTDLIYIAIRRGPMAVPESASEVFAIDTANSSDPWFVSGFPVDMGIWRDVDSVSNNTTSARLIGTNTLNTNLTSAEASFSAYTWDHQTGWMTAGSADSTRYSWMWRRAPNFFDVVAATGGLSGGSLASVPHNLGVTPELIIQKKRSGSSSMDWFVTGSGVGGTDKYLILNSNAAVASTVTLSHDETTFTPIFDQDDFIAYLFASLDGVSKVGSYTGTGAAQNIDCGFSSGARFVLIKRTDSTSSWFVFDSERGIVSGNDPYLYLNLTNAEVTSRDGVDPLSSGFALTTDSTFNASGGSYIFYAIA